MHKINYSKSKMRKNGVFNSFGGVKNILNGIETERTAESSGRKDHKKYYTFSKLELMCLVRRVLFTKV